MAYPISTEDQDNEIEEYMWNLMGRAGLLSEMKSKIAQFVQENGKIKENFFSVNFSRVNPKILSLIYEYLKWVGMKNTCTMLLSESPVAFTTQGDENSGTPSPLPQLCSFLAGRIAQVDNQFMLNENLAASRKSENSTLNSNTNNCDSNNYKGSNSSNNNNICEDANTTSLQSSNSCHPATTHENLDSPSKTPSLASPTEQKQVESKEQDFEHDSFSYSKQYEKERKDKKNVNKMTQKLSEVKLKPSTSDESLQHKAKEQHQFGFGFGFMTEKQKMEALNKKFSGTELTPLDSNTCKNKNDHKNSKGENTKENASSEKGKLLQSEVVDVKVSNVSSMKEENKSESEGEPLPESKSEHPMERKESTNS